MTERDIHQTAVMAGLGLNLDEILLVLSTPDRPLSKKTFQRRRKEMEELETAIRRGMATTRAKIGKALVDQAMNGSLGHIVWWEKTRAGIRELHAREEVQETQKTVLVLPEKDIEAIQSAVDS